LHFLPLTFVVVHFPSCVLVGSIGIRVYEHILLTSLEYTCLLNNHLRYSVL